MSKHTLICLLLLLGMGVGAVSGQDSDSIVGAESVKIPIWDNGFRIGLTSQAQLVLPATLSADDPYVKSLPGFGGENGIELSYHFGYFGVSLGLTFGTFRVFNFKPHFDDAPGADYDDPDFWFYNQFHHYSMVHNVFLPLKFEFHYPFNDKFAIAPEAVFAAQGGKYTEKEDGIKEEITANTNYINVPVMLKYYVAPNFSLDFGPQLGINVYSKFSAKTTGTLAGVTVSEKETIDVKDDTEAIDFGVGLGCTYNLTENAFLQARYTMGLTKVFEDVDGCKNANIQVAFGWKF